MGMGLWGTTMGRILRLLSASGRADWVKVYHSEDVVSVGVADINGKRLYLINGNGEQSAYVSGEHYGSPLEMDEVDPAIPSLELIQGEESVMVYGPDSCLLLGDTKVAAVLAELGLSPGDLAPVRPVAGLDATDLDDDSDSARLHGHPDWEEAEEHADEWLTGAEVEQRVEAEREIRQRYGLPCDEADIQARTQKYGS